jgi:IclR family KDG regulon transcriptional repressor
VTGKSPASQTLARGLQVLNCFLEGETELGISQIAGRLGLAPSIVFRLVKTLEDMGYLYQVPETRRYSLGIQCYLLGMRTHIHQHIKEAARPHMQWLAEATHETVSLNVVDPVTGDGVCIDSIDSPAEIKLTTRVGSVRPLHRGATRKVLLAYLDDDARDKYISKLNLDSVDRDILLQDIQQIRSNGYAYSLEELDAGAYAIAAPIRAVNGRLLAGIAIAGPVYRTTDADKERYTRLVIEAARRVEQALSGSGTTE